MIRLKREDMTDIEWGRDIDQCGNITEQQGFCVKDRENLYIRRSDGEVISDMRMTITFSDERGKRISETLDYATFYTVGNNFLKRLERWLRLKFKLSYYPEEQFVE